MEVITFSITSTMELAAGMLSGVQIQQMIEENEQRKRMDYKNGGITLPQTQFVGPGNRVVDSDNKSNFNSLPDNCLDWIALEHDVDYHNIGSTGNTDIQNVEKLDNKAIDNAWRECTLSQPISTAVLVGGLKTKQHVENLAENVSWPFGKNKSLYPRVNTNTKEIDWFNKKLNRRKNITGKYAI